MSIWKLRTWLGLVSAQTGLVFSIREAETYQIGLVADGFNFKLARLMGLLYTTYARILVDLILTL